MSRGRLDVLDAGVVVVGSGAGGAVAAALLAEGGADVLLLEEGEALPPPEERTREVTRQFAALYRNGGIIPVQGSPPLVFQEGRVLGGGTVVNGGMAWRAPDRALDTWARDHGAETHPPAMDPWFSLVEGGSRVELQPTSTLSEAERLFGSAAGSLGFPVVQNRRFQHECRGSGVCLLGCPRDHKQGAHLTWIPRCLAAGGRVRTGMRVDRILLRSGRAMGVEGRRVGPGGPTRDHFRIRAREVVIAGGALQTPVLLHRSGLGGGRVGRNLLLHPSVRVTGIHARPVRQWAGVHQGLQIHHFLEEGLLLACAGVPPGIVSLASGGRGEEAFRRMEAFDHMVMSAALIEDTTAGRVRVLPGGQPWPSYRFDAQGLSRIERGVRLLAMIHFAAGAHRVLLPFEECPSVDSMEALDGVLRKGVDPSGMEIVTVHAMGTCAMGAEVRRHPVDPRGRLRGVEGVRVADASVLPGSPGINPQLTIQALAARTAVDLLETEGTRLRSPGA